MLIENELNNLKAIFRKFKFFLIIVLNTFENYKKYLNFRIVFVICFYIIK